MQQGEVGIAVEVQRLGEGRLSLETGELELEDLLPERRSVTLQQHIFGHQVPEGALLGQRFEPRGYGESGEISLTRTSRHDYACGTLSRRMRFLRPAATVAVGR